MTEQVGVEYFRRHAGHDSQFHVFSLSVSTVRCFTITPSKFSPTCRLFSPSNCIWYPITSAVETELLNNVRNRDLREIGWDGVDWMDMAQDRDQWRALVNTVLSLRFP
jgi:hypothetical protein